MTDDKSKQCNLQMVGSIHFLKEVSIDVISLVERKKERLFLGVGREKSCLFLWLKYLILMLEI